MIVLDSNVASEPNRPNPDGNVARWLEEQRARDLYLCDPIIAEMAYGAERIMLRSGSDRYHGALERLMSVGFRDRILRFDTAAAARSGRIRAFRERLGRPISVGDAMIAAICLGHGATLATRNIRDFDGLDLALVNPFEA